MKAVKYIIVTFLLLFTGRFAFAQLKLGNNPYTIQPSSILEMESDKQGLLFPRITDTALINSLNPPDGNVIFFTPLKQLMIRTNGSWQPVTMGSSLAGSVWSLTGNAGTTPGAHFIGTTDNTSLRFRTNNTERLYIDSATGYTGIGTSAPGSKLDVNGTLNVVDTATMHGITNTGNLNIKQGELSLSKDGSLKAWLTSASETGFTYPYIRLERSRGTVGEPATVQLYDYIGGLNTYGYGPGGYMTGVSSIAATVAGFNGNNILGKLIFSVSDGTGGGANLTAFSVTSAVSTFYTPATNVNGVLNVSATNPLTLSGVQGGTASDSILTITGGVVKKIAASAVAAPFPSIYSFNNSLGIGTLSLRGSSTGTDNVAYGDSTLYVNTSGYSNTAIGAKSLLSNTTGFKNTALGAASLYNTTTGNGNTAIGATSLSGNTTGNNNTAIGNLALTNSTIGSYNLALGNHALLSNVAGSFGTAIGESSQYYVNNTVTPWVNKNVSVGFQSLMGSTTSANNTGNNNTAIGYQTMTGNTSGLTNTTTGAFALNGNTTGSGNAAFGYGALFSNVAGTGGTAIGESSQYYVNNSATPWTNTNVSIGFQSLRGSAAASANTGNANTAIGFQSMSVNSSGTGNVGAGSQTLINNTTGHYNTATGAWALSSNVSGSNGVAIGNSSQMYVNNTATPWTNSNTSVGYQSLMGSLTPANNTGTSNTAIGNQSLVSTSSGSANTATGAGSLLLNTTGGSNTAMGQLAMGTNTTGSTNTAIGYWAGYTDGTVVTPANLTNAAAIGAYAQVTASNSMVLGGTGVYAVNVGIGTTAPAYKLDVTGTNPLRLTGVQTGADTDSILSIASGVVRKLAVAAVTGSSAWSLTGNTGTTAGTNFIGTADDVDVVFKRNGVQAGLLNNAEYNTAWGVTALSATSSGDRNTAIGYAVLLSNTTGYTNTAMGYAAMQSNTTGYNNVAVGNSALLLNTTGRDNVALGAHTLTYSVAGNAAVAIGNNSQQYANNSATAWTNYNTSVGYQSLRGSATASANTGNANTAIGFQSMTVNSSGASNVGAGSQTLINNTTGNNNVAVGYAAASSNTTGADNVAVGYRALYSSVTGIVGVAIGSGSQEYANNSATTWTNANTSVGYRSLRGSATPSANTGNYNTAVGYFSLGNNTSGSGNVALGMFSLLSNTTGNYNIGIGRYAAYSSITSVGLTAVGHYAGYGDGTVTTPDGLTNATAIGYMAQVTASNSVVLGGTGSYAANVGVGVTAPVSKMDIAGSLGTSITTTTSSITLNETHHTVIVNSPASTAVVTLPAASSCPRREYVIVNITATNVQISTYYTFSNTTSVWTGSNTSITVKSNGTNWYRIQ